MADTNTFKIEEFKQKIDNVLSMYAVLKEEKDALCKEKISLSKTIEELNLRLVEFERKYKDLQVAKAVTQGGGETDVAKKKIDGLVREIDKCIGLLTK
jgi:vacuolar-type H+-ATPase subunit D/Vma8